MERKPLESCVFLKSGKCPPKCDLYDSRKRLREVFDHPRGDLSDILKSRTEKKGVIFTREVPVYEKYCEHKNGKE